MKYISIDCQRQRFNAGVDSSIAFQKSILLLLLLAYNVLTAQVAIDSTKYYDHARAGSVKAITDKEICAIIVFVSGPYTEWSVKKKHKLLKKDREAFKKLKKEFRKFDIDFKLHIETFNLDKDFEVNPADNQANAEKIWHTYTSSEVPFFKENRYRLYDGGYFLIMHHQGMGKSLAAPDYLHGKEGVEICLNTVPFSNTLKTEEKIESTLLSMRRFIYLELGIYMIPILLVLVKTEKRLKASRKNQL